MKFNTLLQRTIFGAIYVAIIILGLLVNYQTFLVLFFVILNISLWEFLKMFREQISGFIGVFITIFLLSNGAFTYIVINEPQGIEHWLLPFIIPAYAVLLYYIFGKREVKYKGPFSALMGFTFILIPMILTILLGRNNFYGEYQYDIILATFILLWLNDTGAYIVGSLIGKKPLAPKISPNKSWEGFVGGIVLAVIAFWVINKFLFKFELRDVILLPLLVGIGGTLGDLIESKFKRTAGVKDSGKLIPGHGGLLDRVDSFLLSIAVVYIYSLFINAL